MLRLGTRDRLNFQCAVVAVAEGAQLSTSRPTAAPYICVAAVLSDARMCALGGRDGLPRSLGSVYAGTVSRFLRGRFTGSRSHRTPSPLKDARVLGVSRDGSRLFVGLHTNTIFAQLCVIETAGGAIIKTIKTTKSFLPRELAVAPDDAVYVIWGVNEISHDDSLWVLDPSLAVCGTIDKIGEAYGLCASVDCVAFVCYARDCEDVVVIMRRHDHAIFRRISVAKHIDACCFTAAGTQLAVVHTFDICILNVADGECARLWNIPPPQPCNYLVHRIKSTDYNELVVSQVHENGTNLIVYDATGHIEKTQIARRFIGIAVFGGAVITGCFDGSDSWFDVYE